VRKKRGKKKKKKKKKTETDEDEDEKRGDGRGRETTRGPPAAQCRGFEDSFFRGLGTFSARFRRRRAGSPLPAG
jgi:hypothetical protein